MSQGFKGEVLKVAGSEHGQLHTFAKDSLDVSVDNGAVAIFENVVGLEKVPAIERVWLSGLKQNEIVGRLRPQ
jgi:hypothetical protein